MKDFVSRLRQGLIAAYCPSLPGGGSGNLLPDQSNLRNNITLTSFSQSDWASSQQGRTLYFDGVDNYGTTQRQIFSGRSIVSVMTWAQTVSGTQIEIGEGDSNTFRTGFGLTGDGNSYIVNSQGGGVVNNFCWASWSAFQGQAVCVVSVLDVTQGTNTDRAKIYIQGLSRSISYSATGPLSSSPIGVFTGATQIGRRPTNDNYSTGNLYCSAVWNRVITAEEAMQLYVLGPRGSSEAVSLKGNFRSTFAKRYTYQPPKAKVFEGVRVRDHDYSSLRNGLVGAWCPSLPNGGSGNLLVDQSQRGNHGVLTNMSAGAWVSGQYGRALDFDGVNDYISFSQNAPMLPGSFAISLWFRPIALNTVNRYILSATTAANDNYYSVIWEYVDNTVEFYAGAGGNGAAFRSNSQITIGETVWYHIVYSFNQSSFTAWRNGTLQNTNTTAVSLNSVVNPSLWLATFSGGGSVANIQLDDVRIYNRALTESEIRLLASRPGIGLQPSPTRFIAREKKTGLRRILMTGQT